MSLLKEKLFLRQQSTMAAACAQKQVDLKPNMWSQSGLRHYQPPQAPLSNESWTKMDKVMHLSQVQAQAPST